MFQAESNKYENPLGSGTGGTLLHRRRADASCSLTR